MIESHVGKVKMDLSTDEFTVIIPLKNKVIAIVKISQKKKRNCNSQDFFLLEHFNNKIFDKLILN